MDVTTVDQYLEIENSLTVNYFARINKYQRNVSYFGLSNASETK